MSTPTTFGRRGAARPAAPARAADKRGGAPLGGPSRGASTTPRAASASPPLIAGLLRLLFSFQGRIRRRDFWLGEIAITVILYVTIVAAAVFGGGPVRGEDQLMLVLSVLFELAVLVLSFWASVALRVKRWHDRDKSGFWVLIAFIPVLGGLWELIELGFLDGTSGDNNYGRSPKWLPELEFA
ncbi:MAG TPA: DUF805 domain-containing protein [Caulobacteraceae bacterium]|nr:DUF805 domain-containing protein [Caulobacteraceae bacterium]